MLSRADESSVLCNEGASLADLLENVMDILFRYRRRYDGWNVFDEPAHDYLASTSDCQNRE